MYTTTDNKTLQANAKIKIEISTSSISTKNKYNKCLHWWWWCSPQLRNQDPIQGTPCSMQVFTAAGQSPLTPHMLFLCSLLLFCYFHKGEGGAQRHLNKYKKLLVGSQAQVGLAKPEEEVEGSWKHKGSEIEPHRHRNQERTRSSTCLLCPSPRIPLWPR